MIEHIMSKTGLSYSTVKELLRAGWTFREAFNTPSVWLSPAHLLTVDKPSIE